MKNKLKNTIFHLTILVIINGCSTNTDQSNSGTSRNAGESNADARPRVALVMKSLANEFFATMAKGAESYAADNSSSVELIVNGIQDETDLTGQVNLVEQMIAQGVNAIVIAPADSRALVPVLKKAHESGIVVINIDNRLDQAALAEAGFTVPFVGPDNRAGAKKVAECLAEQLKTGDQVAILEGITTSFNGQQRKLGFEDAMNAAGVKIVDSQSAQWEMAIADQTASAMLSAHKDLRAILACNDTMALGALAAVRTAGRDNVMIVGFDNISAVQQAIREGRILATADQHGDQLAVFGIEYALQAIKDGNKSLADKQTPVDLITKSDLPTGDADEAR